MERLMADEVASGVFTDPPYSVPIGGHCTGLGSVKHREFAMACGEMSSWASTAFLGEALGHAARLQSRWGPSTTCAWTGVTSMSCSLRDGKSIRISSTSACGPKTTLAWAPSTAASTSLVLVFKHGKGAHTNQVQLGKFGRYRTNVWRCPSVSAFGRTSEEGSLLALHPTVKPVALVADALLDSTSHWGPRSGPLPRQRDNADGGRTCRAAMSRARTRPALRGRDHPALAGLDRRKRSAGWDRPVLQRTQPLEGRRKGRE